MTNKRLTVADLAWRLASHRADDAGDAERLGDDDGLRRTIRIAIQIHGWHPDRIAGVIPQIAEMGQAGTITVRSMDGDSVNPPVEVVSAKPDAWWLTADDAQHVVASLWPQVRRDTLTAVVETIAKRLHGKDYLAEFAFAKSLRDEMQRAIDSEELPVNERRNAEIWLNEYDVDEWLARERKPYRLGLVAQNEYDQAEMERAGRLELERVASTLATATGIEAERWQSTIVDAIKRGELPLKNPRNLADPLPYAVPKNLRTFYDRVDVADLNRWLDENPDWGVAYRFTVEVTAPASVSLQSAVPETDNSAMSGAGNEGLTKRERQIRAIEAAADTKGFRRTAIPDGGKKVLREYCKHNHADLFGAGDSPFNDAWKEASPERVAMANRAKYAGE